MAEDKKLCVGQKAFINKNGEVLVFPTSVGVDFPGGKVQEGETDMTAALRREVKEEANLEIEIGDPFVVWYFEFPSSNHTNAGKHVYLIGFRCTYVSGNVRLSHEHDSYKWVNKNNYRELAEDSDYFRALEKYFTG